MKRTSSEKKSEHTAVTTSLFRAIPSIDATLRDSRIHPFSKQLSHQRLVSSIRNFQAELRVRLRTGYMAEGFDEVLYFQSLAAHLDKEALGFLRTVINATGIIVHTNLGRSIFSDFTAQRVAKIVTGYSNLEYDLDVGKRSSRYNHLVSLLQELTGYEDSLIVNNNAAAVLLALDTFAQGTEVILSRGELVEIGGGFRIPDVMKKAGVELIEVGCTNKTRLSDYESAITENTSMIIRIHRSNFAMSGFTEEPDLSDLVELANRRGILMMYDLGSGNLLPPPLAQLFREPTIAETQSQGAHIVTFSGDKLLGGPQAGIILAREELISRLKKNQLLRALRVDKMCIAALEATLDAYTHEVDVLCERIPTIAMLREPQSSVRTRGRRMIRQISGPQRNAVTMKLVDGFSQLGGGSLPHQQIPTSLVSLSHASVSASTFDRLLRQHNPPVVSLIRDDTLLFDLRTVPPVQEKVLFAALRDILEQVSYSSAGESKGEEKI